ncbi:hypothetical protein GCM10017083_26090 [Thalassobaculum fulvum]|uniref:Uncharacterized protein n=1 Tax=Thalassobaculum fulvum TaxID=1633335 RepID=A0A918XSH7_9PROT|nr:hypothetical protein GCM10017083_26090 [Thalassobaculum fulvum]
MKSVFFQLVETVDAGRGQDLPGLRFGRPGKACRAAPAVPAAPRGLTGLAADRTIEPRRQDPTRPGSIGGRPGAKIRRSDGRARKKGRLTAARVKGGNAQEVKQHVGQSCCTAKSGLPRCVTQAEN